LELDPSTNKYYFTDATTGKNYFILRSTSLDNEAQITINNNVSGTNFFTNGFMNLQRYQSPEPMDDLSYNLDQAFNVTYVGTSYGEQGKNIEYTSYPKPSKYAKDIKQRFGDIPMIMLSGTPTPESYSQYYHLFWLSNNSPFKEYTNFYKWANEYVNIEP
jgi:hypothetical protein